MGLLDNDEDEDETSMISTSAAWRQYNGIGWVHQAK